MEVEEDAGITNINGQMSSPGGRSRMGLRHLAAAAAERRGGPRVSAELRVQITRLDAKEYWGHCGCHLYYVEAMSTFDLDQGGEVVPVSVSSK